MPSDSERSTFRRLPAGLSLIRAAVRRWRLFQLTWLNRGKLHVHDPATVAIGTGANVAVPEFFEIEPHVSIGAYFMTHTNIRIGAESLLSSRVSFIGNDHDLYGSESAYFSGRTPPSTVILEGNNFIGFGATLCGNVTLGKGSIVGAHALVLESVPANAVVAGVPARIIAYRPGKEPESHVTS